MALGQPADPLVADPGLADVLAVARGGDQQESAHRGECRAWLRGPADAGRTARNARRRRRARPSTSVTPAHQSANTKAASAAAIALRGRLMTSLARIGPTSSTTILCTSVAAAGVADPALSASAPARASRAAAARSGARASMRDDREQVRPPGSRARRARAPRRRRRARHAAARSGSRGWRGVGCGDHELVDGDAHRAGDALPHGLRAHQVGDQRGPPLERVRSGRSSTSTVCEVGVSSIDAHGRDAEVAASRPRLAT